MHEQYLAPLLHTGVIMLNISIIVCLFYNANIPLPHSPNTATYT